MKWKGNVQESCQRPGEVGTRSNEVGKEDRGSPDEPRSVSTSPSESEASEASERVRGESEVREDFGVTGRGSDAKGVNGREAERGLVYGDTAVADTGSHMGHHRMRCVQQLDAIQLLNRMERTGLGSGRRGVRETIWYYGIMDCDTNIRYDTSQTNACCPILSFLISPVVIGKKLLSLKYRYLGDRLAIGAGSTIVFHEASSGLYLHHAPFSANITSMQWLRDDLLYLGFDDGELLAISPNDNAELLEIKGFIVLEEGTPVTQFHVHPENKGLVAAGGGLLRVWFRPNKADTWHAKAIQRPALRPSAQREAFILVVWIDEHILMVYHHHGAMLWDPVTHFIVAEIRIEGPIISADVSPNRRLLAVSAAEQYKIFEISSGSLETSFPSPVVAEEP
ncbi:hypothetical protein PLEOSDRAFT_170890 [Pleurotus ostreatus PC15]|uniref:Uncharacterized protein n=1 Tax=Pleurotus ostreatus (strain PC15) TaxID=1137138 RepID=A0A067N7E8_PLEO1|nr:hypothetical protein PLEOSDRAFT_170890 [Pleurotus ostreatus PC15]